MIMIIRLEIMLYTNDRKRHASFSLKAEKFIFQFSIWCHFIYSVQFWHIRCHNGRC